MVQIRVVHSGRSDCWFLPAAGLVLLVASHLGDWGWVAAAITDHVMSRPIFVRAGLEFHAKWAQGVVSAHDVQ